MLSISIILILIWYENINMKILTWKKNNLNYSTYNITYNKYVKKYE